ncbi:MAG: phage tail protein [bacterium]|nr:phage tail protein [bacterium]
MADPFIGEIRMFAGNFAPRGWAFCDGQLLAVSSNEALFSLLGTIYGGDGRTTFGLPDLRGRLPIHQGQGPGLTGRDIGSRDGVETAPALTEANLPGHSHPPVALSTSGTNSDPANGTWANASAVHYTTDQSTSGTMNNDAILDAGQSSPATHPNLMPFAVINFIIALVGIFPTRN